MKHMYLLPVLLLTAFLFTGCENKDDDVQREEYSVFDLHDQNIDYSYYLTDGKIEVLIQEDPTTKKPTHATIHNPANQDNINLFFNEQGCLNVIEIDKNYIVLGDYQSTGMNAAVVTNNEILSFNDINIAWDADFYEAWNEATLTKVDWGRFGRLWWEEFKPTLIGVGYGLKAAKDICTVLAPDPSIGFIDRRLAMLGIAGNLGAAISEGLPESDAKTYLREFSDNVLTSKDVAQTARDIQSGESVTSMLMDYFKSYITDFYADVLIDMGKKTEEIQLAQYVTDTGSGDIQVTLRWSNYNDIDLHVVDPYGEEIYFYHPRSNSGGFLDYDNVTAYGPENVFWSSTNLTGMFKVYVNHYSGSSSTTYTIFIKAFGRCRTFQGSLAVERSAFVASFNQNGIYSPNETPINPSVGLMQTQAEITRNQKK